MKWGVKAYQDWRKNRIEVLKDYDINIFNANLSNVKALTKQSLIASLCKFIPEVTKSKSGEEYPGKTLYQLVISIQSYLNESGKPWKLVEGPEFIEVRTVLDNLMKERHAVNIGTVKHQADLISYDYENRLWESNILGESNPDQLRNTVLFLIGMNIGLRAGEERYNL